MWSRGVLGDVRVDVGIRQVEAGRRHAVDLRLATSFRAPDGRPAGNHLHIDVAAWQWAVLVGLIFALLLVDLLVFHKEAHEVDTKEAAIESAVWIGIGVLILSTIVIGLGNYLASR